MAEKTASASYDIHYGVISFELTTSNEGDLPIYIAGNFNDWNANDEQFRLQRVGKGRYRLQLTNKGNLPNILEYKYTRGNWQRVELDDYGNEVANRLENARQNVIRDFVPRWKMTGSYYNEKLLPKIITISEAFEIPQLIKTRRISALLPHNYDESDRHYPVLYLQDGQNLFDDYAPFGNWAVDKKLAVLAEMGMDDIIIIAIDHAEEERIKEFTPSMNTRLGRGSGKKYVRFLADTLKPYVDRHFRTKPERHNTGIGGSSMGGLISIYAGFMYPEVYSKLLVFSPSLWVVPGIHFEIMSFDEAFDMQIYLYAGGEESKFMVPNVHRFVKTVEDQGLGHKIKFNISIDPQGKHSEARWGEEFPKAVEWLFFNGESQKT
jgi:predicted alpha/beta superfamily hydrolase